MNLGTSEGHDSRVPVSPCPLMACQLVLLRPLMLITSGRPTLDSVQIFPESAYGVYVWAIYEFALAYDGTGIEH